MTVFYDLMYGVW